MTTTVTSFHRGRSLVRALSLAACLALPMGLAHAQSAAPFDANTRVVSPVWVGDVVNPMPTPNANPMIPVALTPLPVEDRPYHHWWQHRPRAVSSQVPGLVYCTGPDFFCAVYENPAE